MTTPVKQFSGDDLIEAMGQKVTMHKQLVNQIKGNQLQIEERNRQIANYTNQISALEQQRQQLDQDIQAMRAAIAMGTPWPPQSPQPPQPPQPSTSGPVTTPAPDSPAPAPAVAQPA